MPDRAETRARLAELLAELAAHDVVALVAEAAAYVIDGVTAERRADRTTRTPPTPPPTSSPS